MAGLRQVLGVEVRAGNEHTAKHAQPGLLKILDDLPPGRKPKLVRGDNAFGNDSMMTALEERGSSLTCSSSSSRRTSSVTLAVCFANRAGRDAGQGWEGKDGELALSRLGDSVVASSCCADHSWARSWWPVRMTVSNCWPSSRPTARHGKGITGYEYAVLVTNTDYEILSLGQLYRDRADAENAFDELKNQWGWGGFTTHDLHRCQLAARAVALIYNWWSLFVRLANPEARREAITSRPWLMSSVGRRTEHAGQTTITLTGLHAHFEKARAALMRVSALLQGWVDSCCGAVESDHRLASRLRSSQTRPRRHRAASPLAGSRKSCKRNRLTAVFRFNHSGHVIRARPRVRGAHPSMIIPESSVLLQINPFLPAVRTFIVASSSFEARLQKTGIGRVRESFHEKSARQDAPGSTQ